MSTNSTIAIKLENGTIEGIYCHWDGYIEDNGLLLYNYYQDESKIKELISMGYASSIRKEISFSDKTKKNTFLEDTDFNVCVFYHRDRGDKLMIDKAKNEKEFCKKYAQTYNYLYKNQEWYVKRGRNGHYVKLEKSLHAKGLLKEEL